MSVLIKGVDTPLTCWGCPCFDDKITHYCCVLDRYCDDYKNNRLNDCPLVEVPTPHGRLIDADEIEKCVHEWYDVGEYVFADAIRNADTIIEAENSSAIDDDVKKYCDYLKSETYDFCNRIENGEVSE